MPSACVRKKAASRGYIAFKSRIERKGMSAHIWPLVATRPRTPRGYRHGLPSFQRDLRSWEHRRDLPPMTAMT